MPDDALVEQIVRAWRAHNGINLRLIEAIPTAGFAAVPLKSRGRTVGKQLRHMNEVRAGWLRYHTTGKRPKKGTPAEGAEPHAEQLVELFDRSGVAVEEYLRTALAEGRRTRMFGGSPVRWMASLISHESHHRGQIALALKQQGLRLPENVALRALWGGWIFGK